MQVKDAQGNDLSLQVKVSIVDDMPSISVGQPISATSGNSAGAAAGSLSYAFGADGVQTFTVNGKTFNVPTAGQSTVITGTYGTLSVNADGSYSYQAHANTGGKSENFTFEIIDADGDKVDATLSVSITAAANPGEPVTVTVNEKGLNNPVDHSEQASVSAPAGYTITGGGQGSYGEVKLVDGQWTYVLDKAYGHSDGQGAGTAAAADTVTVQVKDAQGNDLSLQVKVSIVDDMPTATPINKGSLTEDGAVETLSGNVAIDNGNSFGADGAASQGAITWGTVTATLGGQSVTLSDYGVFKSNADGSWSFTLDNSKSATQALKDGETITVKVDYSLTDKDGDTQGNIVSFSIKGTNDAKPDEETTREDTSVSGNVLSNDEGYKTGVMLVTSFSVNGHSYVAGSGAVNVSDTSGKVIGSIKLEVNGEYTFTPTKDWSGSVPTITYTSNSGTSSTLDIKVTPVADIPVVSVVLGAGSIPVTTSIDATTVLSKNSGYTVTAKDMNGNAADISTFKGSLHDGFGVTGVVTGNTAADTGEIAGNGSKSESLTIAFNTPVTTISVQFAWLASTEWARYQMFDEAGNAVVLGFNADGSVNKVSGLYGFVKGGGDTVETAFSLSVPVGSTISKIVFDAARAGDDYLIHQVTYTTAITYPVTITVAPTDIDYSESVKSITVEVAEGVTLSAGTQRDATHWELPLVSNGSYVVQIDSVTKAVTITGLSMTVPDNVTSAGITVTGTVVDGADTNSASASTGSVLATNDAATASLSAETVKGETKPLAANFTTSETWAFSTPATNGNSPKGFDLNSALNQAGWVSTSTKSGKSTSYDVTRSSSALVLKDTSSSSDIDAQLLTPVYLTGNKAGNVLSFDVTKLANYSSSDVITWTLYKQNANGSWSVAETHSITAMRTFTTEALDANTNYRIHISANDESYDSDSKDSKTLAVTLDNFTVSAADFVAWTPGTATGNILTNDHAGSGNSLSVSVDHGMSWKVATSAGIDIQGDYGSLHISSNGDYVYTPSTPSAGVIYQSQQDVFTYKILAADGSHAEAQLTVTLNASGPTVTTGSATADTVHEVYGTPAGDTLLGTEQDDWFIWTSSDHGSSQIPGADVVRNFGKAGNDVLVLNDLLQGEEKSGDLSKFLHLETQTESNGVVDTVIKVSSTGGLAADGSGFNQKIVLEGVDLLGAGNDQNAMIQKMITDGKLKIDQS